MHRLRESDVAVSYAAARITCIIAPELIIIITIIIIKDIYIVQVSKGHKCAVSA